MRKTQRMTEFVGNATDKNRVVFPQRYVSVLPVVNLVAGVFQVRGIQNGGVQLPRRARP